MEFHINRIQLYLYLTTLRYQYKLKPQHEWAGSKNPLIIFFGGLGDFKGVCVRELSHYFDLLSLVMLISSSSSEGILSTHQWKVDTWFKHVWTLVISIQKQNARLTHTKLYSLLDLDISLCHLIWLSYNNNNNNNNNNNKRGSPTRQSGFQWSPH